MFRGLNSLTLDNKGRFAMPTVYRDKLCGDDGVKLIITIDTEEKCLLLYTLESWLPIEKRLQNLPSLSPAARRIQRILIGHATELQLDKTGRIRIPPLLRDFANLDKNVTLVGQGNKFEIWNESTWNEERKEWLSTEQTSELPEAWNDLSL